MYRKLILSTVLLFVGVVSAAPIEITPAQKISTTTKNFAVGNIYNFKDVKTGEIYKGEVVYYRPNGSTGKEAQVEFGNFTNSSGEPIAGKVTVIPSNHKNYQEYVNYFNGSACIWIRGSEVILREGKQTFLIDYNNDNSKTFSIKLVPTGKISTTHDELEYGDIIEFKSAYDVYKNEKLYIKANTPVFGEIDYIDENGWCFDNAAIYIKKFKTKTVEGENVTLNSYLKIEGLELLQYKSKRIAQFFNYISVLFRGKEVDIKTCDTNVNFVITVEE
ncbi:hypothetical protein IKQ21_09860 [bacterium]|nr:hypothetical protein [bacterium]